MNLLRIEIARFEQEKRRLELDRKTEAVRLNQLMNRAVDAPVWLSAELSSPAFDPSRAAGALTRRPDLEGVRLAIDRARADARLAHAESWEDWTVGAGYANDRQVFGGQQGFGPNGQTLFDKDKFLGLSVGVPFPLWNRNQGRVVTARADEKRATALLAAAERTAEGEVATAQTRVEELARVAREYDDSLLPLSQRNVELLERGYRQGLAPITTFVQAEQQLSDTFLRRAQTLGELRQAEIDLETAAAASPLLGAPPSTPETRP